LHGADAGLENEERQSQQAKEDRLMRVDPSKIRWDSEEETRRNKAIVSKTTAFSDTHRGRWPQWPVQRIMHPMINSIVVVTMVSLDSTKEASQSGRFPLLSKWLFDAFLLPICCLWEGDRKEKKGVSRWSVGSSEKAG
jgi:hypothetical protein